MDELKHKLYKLAEKIAEREDVELFDIDIVRGRKLILRVIIDKESGVSIEDCERMSRALEAILDVEDPIKEPYVLEVSSPGIDRPLRGRQDFIKYMGRKARIITKEKVENQNFFVGKIEGAMEDGIILRLKNKSIFIKYSNISRANLEVEV